ncbi:OmpA family protein [Burkholderia vietnamiensis]|uniref:OmpA family protein n=1 Tax=Burkholderia vietnamiensis TaxID=60552 RepID=UPI0015930EE8|nr:OmpA family protein [Burkholderia vietnamiensis]MCA7946504.1 OmpA family protein [Burkholderia vietnamiensis]HDR8974574.1 OmpA family protein [Burkholderia vietnamiensis]HDR9144540.1 OmpA family protein [Burkholderia vietnamiensis]HDR9223654.1 OmpA family protein [Burkholderia vietnamiensis]
MNKLALALGLSALGLAACSTASGPTYSASELQPRDGVRTFQVGCHGVLSGPQTCMNAARKICGEQPVRVADSAHALRNHADPATLVFQCGAAPAETAAAAAPVPTPAPAPAPAAVEHVNLAGDALFATGQATLTPAARASLDKLLSEREDRTYTEVTVTGHTDSAGSDAANLALSKRRADVVARYLHAHGLKAHTMTVAGRGSADPVGSNATAEGRAANRRVSIVLGR